MFLYAVDLIGVTDAFGLATIVRGLRIPAFTLDRE